MKAAIKYWTIGTLKESIFHLALALGIWLVLWSGYDSDSAFLGAGLWFGGREAYDFEQEKLQLRPALRPAFNLGLTFVVILVCLWLGTVTETPIGVACWLLAQLARRAEITALPIGWALVRLPGEAPLRPAPLWSRDQLRHSISGWVPVCIICVAGYIIL